MRAALLAAIALLWATPGHARELWRDGERVLEFSGSVRELLTTSNGTDPEAFAADAASDPRCAAPATFADCGAFTRVGDRDVWESLTRLRLRFDAVLGSGIEGVLVYDNEWRFGVLDQSLFAGARERDTFLGLEDEVHAFGLRNTDHRSWRHRAYRAYLQYEGEKVALRVGRQRIAWGVGRLWNPIDRLNAIGPLAIEGDQFPGIDAVDLRWRFSGFSYLQWVYAPETSSDESRTAVRFHGVVGDVDLSVMAGIFEEARTIGTDLAGNLGDSAWRVEAVYTSPERDVWELDAPAPREVDSFWQIVVSLDRNLDIGTGVYVLLEHLYDGNALGLGEGEAGALLPFFGTGTNGAPEPISSDRFGGSRVVSLARHATGVQVGYDLTSALRGDLLLLWDWNGSSAAIAPSVRFGGWNSFELTLGAQVFTGSDTSQFGDRQALVYALAEVFF